MAKRMGPVAIFGLVLLAGSATQVAAQAGCRESIGESTAATRETALRQAYEGVLHGLGDVVWRQWLQRGQRIGEAPGYTIRKLGTSCAPRGSGIFCRITAFACKA